MTDISKPDVFMPIVPAGTSVINDSRRIEIVGCMGTDGSATAKELYSNVEKTQIASLFESNSEIADAFDAAREISEIVPIDVIPIDEPATGTADVKTLTLSGLATAAGTIVMGISNSRYGEKTVNVPKLTGGSATSPSDIATLIAAAYAASTKLVSTVAVDGVTAEQVNVTYNHKGLQGVGNVVWAKSFVPGIAIALAVDAAGVGAPDIADIYDVNGNQRYSGIAQPGEWSISELTDFLDARFNVPNKVLDGTGFICKNATGSVAVSTAAALNSQSLSHQFEDTEATSWWLGSSLFEGNLARSAQAAILKAHRLTTGSDTTPYVAGQSGIDDTTGGVSLASLPYMNTAMPWPVMQTGYGYSSTEVAAIKDAGGWVAGNNDAGSGVVLGEVVTTYKTNDQGDDDISFKYLNYVDTITEIRSHMMTNIKAACRQSRATAGALAPRRNINNELSLTGKFTEYFGDCGDLLLAQKGEAAAAFFAKHFSIVIDGETGDAVASMQVPIVIQLRSIVAPIQIAFNLNG